MELRVTKEQKDFIKNKSEEMGFGSVTAFLIQSAENHFRLNIDMSAYKKLANEINYIGKNINSLVRKVNALGVYSDNDIDFLKNNQKAIIGLMNKEYDRLLNLKANFTSENMSLKEKESLIKALEENQIEVPKKVILEEIYEQITDDFSFIGEAIANSPEQEKDVEDYVWEYLYGETLFALDEKKLIEFANKIFIFTQKLKMKLLKLDNIFDNDDWFSLKDILDEYEIY
ncbi:MAG: hypothetical protein WAM95_15605 [Bacillus sp. (in: firmicutes)]